jgi:hypothetical protein
LSVELKFGAIPAMRRGYPPGMTRMGTESPAERVLGARPMLHDEDADPIGRGDAADRVRHVQARALLPDDDRADVGLSGRFDDGVDRVADEKLDSLTLQDLCNGSGGLHGGSSLEIFPRAYSTPAGLCQADDPRAFARRGRLNAGGRQPRSYENEGLFTTSA